jgi:hypothetical protein
MIPCLNHWPLSSDAKLQGLPALVDAPRRVRDAGFSNYEPAIDPAGPLRPDPSEHACKAICAATDASDVHVSTVACGLSWGTNPVSDHPAVRERSRADTQYACTAPPGWAAKNCFATNLSSPKCSRRRRT